MENKILSLKEMQDMFCDYVFKKLSDEERQAFENSLFKYPDLIKELDEVNLAHNKMQQLNLEKKMSAYTRNLSVKVNERLSNESRTLFKYQRFSKYLIPVSGLALILLIVLYFNLFENNGKVNVTKINKQNSLFTGITQTDIDSLFKNTTDNVNLMNGVQELVPGTSQIQSDLLVRLDKYDTGTMLTDVYNEILTEQILLDASTFSKFENTKQYDLFNDFENLEEKDIENILKELENADFNT